MLYRANFVSTCTLILTMWAGFVWSAVPASLAQAQSSDFTATVDLNTTSVIAGESVELQWYVTGGPATCTITNGVGEFAVTQNPEGGTVTAIPPASGEPFVISCTRGGSDGSPEIATDTLVVVPDPVITLESNIGTEVVGSLSGANGLVFSWNSQYATACSDISYVQASNPAVERQLTNDWSFGNHDPNTGLSDRYQTSGYVFTSVSETTTFSLTCYNSVADTETTQTLTITVTDPPPPDPPRVVVVQPSGTTVSRTRDAGRNYATVRYEFTAENASYCTDYQAYTLDGYPNETIAMPEGYYTGTSFLLHRDMELRFGTSTILTVTCGRPAITLGGVTYPATSTTHVQTFIITGDLTEDVVTIPPTEPAVTLTVNPAEVERDMRTGVGYVTATITATNVDYCWLRSYRVSDGESYYLAGWPSEWWRRYWSDTTQTVSEVRYPALAEPSRLEVTCRNIYHDIFGTPAMQAVAVVSTSTTVTVNPPTSANAPEVRLYSGPSFHLTAADIWTARTTASNMHYETDRFNILNSDGKLQVTGEWGGGPPLQNLTGSVSFPFEHPHGTGRSSLYDIYLGYCDTSAGAAEYTISTDRTGVIATLTSDAQYPSQGASCYTGTEELTLLEDGVVLVDGDEITIECTASQADPTSWDAELCDMTDIYFGTGHDSTVVTVPKDEAAPQNTLIWMTDYTTRCDDFTAETDTGFTYTWSNSNQTAGVVTDSVREPITTYSITCGRLFDSLTDTATVQVVTSNDPDVPIVAEEETVIDEVTYEIGQCWDVRPEPDVLAATSPENHVVAPDGLELVPDIYLTYPSQCVPLVDLLVTSPYRGTNLSTDSVVRIDDGVDNVNGTYNLSIIPYVENISNIDLPANASIPYRITFGTDGSVEPATGYYNHALPAHSESDTYPLVEQAYNGIQFGTYDVAVRFNLDGTPNFPDRNFANNQLTEDVHLPVPQPHITLGLLDGQTIIDTASADPAPLALVRASSTVSLAWSVNVNYPLNCELVGPTVGTQPLVLDTVGTNQFGTNPATGIIPVTVQGLSEFTITCTEPTTNEQFVHSGTIEVVPNFEEL